jgi:hypothetical protein
MSEPYFRLRAWALALRFQEEAQGRIAAHLTDDA